AGRLTWRFQYCAVIVVGPAVVGAANPPLADNTVFKRRAEVTAVAMHQTEIVALVAEQDEVLTEYPDRHRNILEFFSHRNRVPKTPQVFPSRRQATDAGQRRVFLGRTGQ